MMTLEKKAEELLYFLDKSLKNVTIKTQVKKLDYAGEFLNRELEIEIECDLLNYGWFKRVEIRNILDIEMQDYSKYLVNEFIMVSARNLFINTNKQDKDK